MCTADEVSCGTTTVNLCRHLMMSPCCTPLSPQVCFQTTQKMLHSCKNGAAKHDQGRLTPSKKELCCQAHDHERLSPFLQYKTSTPYLLTNPSQFGWFIHIDRLAVMKNAFDVLSSVDSKVSHKGNNWSILA